MNRRQPGPSAAGSLSRRARVAFEIEILGPPLNGSIVSPAIAMSQLSKEQSRARWSSLRGLFCEWDPIGVMDDPEWPRDEYDCMVGPSLRLLEAGAPEEEIAEYLFAEITGHFGLSGDRHGCRSFARRLRGWFTDWKQAGGAG